MDHIPQSPVALKQKRYIAAAIDGTSDSKQACKWLRWLSRSESERSTVRRATVSRPPMILHRLIPQPHRASSNDGEDADVAA